MHMTKLDALRAEALAARAAADPNRAVRAWRALLDAAPDDWASAWELREDLRAGLHDPDCDARFRRAARLLPDAAWLDHYGSRGLFSGGDLGTIDARARAMLARQPGEVRLHGILGHVARQRRDWDEAARAFAAAERDGLASHARMYARLAERAWPDAGLAYRLLVVNLDRNTERMEEIGRQFADSPVQPERLAGVEGSRLAGPAARRLTGQADAPRGTLGCFLSHAAAWEALLTGPDACAFVVEDDAIPLLRLPTRLGGLGLPEAWDVVWVNDRMEPGGDPDAVRGFGTEAVAARAAAFEAGQNAVGTDGYLVSRVGARKLLEWVAADGMAENVDWRMLAYALTPGDVAAVPEGSVARAELERLAPCIARAERLDAYVLAPALIRSVSVSSDREDQDRGDWP